MTISKGAQKNLGMEWDGLRSWIPWFHWFTVWISLENSQPFRIITKTSCTKNVPIIVLLIITVFSQTPPPKKKKHRVAYCDRTFHEVLWPYSPPQSLQESDPQMAPQKQRFFADKMPSKKKNEMSPKTGGGVIFYRKFHLPTIHFQANDGISKYFWGKIWFYIPSFGTFLLPQKIDGFDFQGKFSWDLDTATPGVWPQTIWFLRSMGEKRQKKTSKKIPPGVPGWLGVPGGLKAFFPRSWMRSWDWAWEKSSFVQNPQNRAQKG